MNEKEQVAQAIAIRCLREATEGAASAERLTIIAHAMFAKYTALTKAGFSPEQALFLVAQSPF